MKTNKPATLHVDLKPKVMGVASALLVTAMLASGIGYLFDASSRNTAPDTASATSSVISVVSDSVKAIITGASSNA
jgi:hypothetical protein